MARIIAAVVIGIVGLAMIVVPALGAARLSEPNAPRKTAAAVFFGGFAVVGFAIWLAVS